jgi:hypothetical protein
MAWRGGRIEGDVAQMSLVRRRRLPRVGDETGDDHGHVTQQTADARNRLELGVATDLEAWNLRRHRSTHPSQNLDHPRRLVDPGDGDHPDVPGHGPWCLVPQRLKVSSEIASRSGTCSWPWCERMSGMERRGMRRGDDCTRQVLLYTPPEIPPKISAKGM